MSLVSINDVLKITAKVEKIHPYKVVGDRDSYSPYNEGWSDCVSLIESYLEKIPYAESEQKKGKVTLLNTGLQHFVWGTCECGRQVEKPGRNDQSGAYYCPRCGAKLEWE